MQSLYPRACVADMNVWGLKTYYRYIASMLASDKQNRVKLLSATSVLRFHEGRRNKEFHSDNSTISQAL